MTDNIAKLNETLDSLLQWINTTASPFVSEQTPLVIEEILHVNLALGITQIILGLLLLVTAAICGYIMIREDSKPIYAQNTGALTVVFILGIPAIIVGCVSFGFGLYTTLMVTLAPRLFIIEYLKNLL